MSSEPTWNDFAWPEWVPLVVQKQIEDTWKNFGRDLIDYYGAMDDARQGGYDVPPLGTVTTRRRLYRHESGHWATGRFVYAWNNIARLIADDGYIEYVSLITPQEVGDVL